MSARIGFLISLVLSVIGLGAGPLGAQPFERVKMGIILPLSGEAASTGTGMSDAVKLAYKKLSPEVRSRLELVFEDDRFDPKATVVAFNKLLTVDRVQVVLCAGSGAGNAIAPLGDQHRIPIIAIATDPQVVAGRKYVVSLWPPIEAEADLLVKEALHRGYRRIARISTQHSFSGAVKAAFDRSAAGRFQLVLDEEVTGEVRDFRTFLAKLRKQPKVDAIYSGLLFGQAGIFAKQARQSGVDLPQFAFEIFEEDAEIKASKGALHGAWYVNIGDPRAGFLSEYRAAFPGASVFGAANGYDAVTLVAKAVETTSTKNGINDFLHNVKNFTGALGTYSSVGNQFSLPVVIKEVTAEGGKAVEK